MDYNFISRPKFVSCPFNNRSNSYKQNITSLFGTNHLLKNLLSTDDIFAIRIATKNLNETFLLNLPRIVFWQSELLENTWLKKEMEGIKERLRVTMDEYVDLLGFDNYLAHLSTSGFLLLKFRYFSDFCPTKPKN